MVWHRIGGFDLCVLNFNSESVWINYYPSGYFSEFVLSAKRTVENPCRYSGEIPELLGQDPDWASWKCSRAIWPGLARYWTWIFGCRKLKRWIKARGWGGPFGKNQRPLYQINQSGAKSRSQRSILSAKMRLGFNDTSLAIECASNSQRWGRLLVFMLGPKLDGYKPPAYWEWNSKNKTIASPLYCLPMVKIWSKRDGWENCQLMFKLRKLMVGRGA